MKITKLNFLLFIVLIQFSCVKKDELCETVSLATPQITSNSPVPIGTDIQLSVPAIEGAGYFWSRATFNGDYSQSIALPTIGFNDSGTIYFKYTTPNGCESDYVSTKIVMIDPVAPCPLTHNRIQFSNGNYPDADFSWVDTLCDNSDEFYMDGYFSAGDVFINFSECKAPQTGVYNVED